MRTTSYLSLLNAMIEAMYWVVAQRKRYEVQQAGLVPPNVFVNSDRTALVAELRLGWPALDGKIVLESDGNTAAYAALMIHSTSFGLPAFFELDPETLGLIDQLHERAGMFAWRDTYCDMLGWDDAHMEWAVARAIVPWRYPWRTWRTVPDAPDASRCLALMRYRLPNTFLNTVRKSSLLCGNGPYDASARRAQSFAVDAHIPPQRVPGRPA